MAAEIKAFDGKCALKPEVGDRRLYTRLVLSGGGTKGLAQLGALHHYWETGVISHDSLTHCAGSSVGSLIGLLLVCGYTPYDIWLHIYSLDSIFWAQAPASPAAYFKDFGFMSVSGVLGKVEELVRGKFDSVPTMGELYEYTKKILVVTVTNYTLRRVEYCSHVLTPTLSCMDVVRASANIPGIFKKILWNKHVYVDGSIMDNFPVLPIDDGKSRLLGIFTGSSAHLPCEDDDLMGYLGACVTMPITALTRQTIKSTGSNCTILELSVKSLAPLEFVVHVEKRRALFLEGYRAANEIKADRHLIVQGYVPPCVFDVMHRG